MLLGSVSPSLFNAHAIGAAAEDTHLQPGNHLRVNAHPRLGLPVAPFVIWRATVFDDVGLKFRSNVLFLDKNDRRLVPPFELTPDNPVTAYIALRPGETCLYARALVDPAPRASRSSPRTIRPTIASAAIGRTRPRTARVVDSRSATEPQAVGSGVVVEAFVDSAVGPACVGRRDSESFAFSAPGIVKLRLAGTGDVVGVVWLEMRDVDALKFSPWAILTLPHIGGARYLSVDGALARAGLRVLHQAPRRRPLQEASSAVPLANMPPEDPLFEAQRVTSLAGPLTPDLDSLITDTSESPFDQVVEAGLKDAAGAAIGTATQRRIDRFFQAQLDPGSAALLGYKIRDEEMRDATFGLSVYWVAGFFRDHAPPIDGQDVIDGLIGRLGPENRIGSATKLVETVRLLMEGIPNTKLNEDKLPAFERANDYVGLGTFAVVDHAAPMMPMPTPRITAATHAGWIPEVPPAARREVRLDLADIAIGGMLAAMKQTPGNVFGGVVETLNPANREGFHLPVVLALDLDDETRAPASEAGTGKLNDRNAAAETITYFVAQQDRFGRWSPWASAMNDPGPRPRPPRPVLRALYTQPVDPATSGGTVRVLVDVPPLASLAPGAHPIRELFLQGSYVPFGTPVSLTTSVGDPLAPATRLDFTFAGPVLAPQSSRELTLLARWRDTTGGTSFPSEPLTLTMHDPRPPAPLALPTTPPDALDYSSRPDVAGLSMVEYAWTPAPEATYAVYYSDENRLMAHLARAGASADDAALLASLRAQKDPAARATSLRANAARFGAHLFERLNGVVVDGAAGQTMFRHAVSGSLRVLNVYRIGAEASATNAAVDVTTLPLLVFAVPSADPPAKPVLAAAPGTMASNGDTYAATLSITVTPGATEARTWRLRRSNLGGSDPLRMPIVATGPIDPRGADDRQHVEGIVDAGAVVIAPTAKLQPWVRYHWVAEVQGAPAPGSEAAGRAVPGAWSAPSDPVSLILVPPLPPEPVARLRVEATPVGANFTAVSLVFGHKHGLSGGASGTYRVRLMRRVPKASMETLSEAPIAGAGPFKLAAGDPADEVPARTVFAVVVIDPLGRESAVAEVMLR